MPRSKKNKLAAMFSGLEESVNKASVVARKIPSILEFCDSPDYLALPQNVSNPITLFPMQRLILKAFYRGTEGNEDLTFNEEEMEILREAKLDSGDRGNVIGKISNGHIFRELVLVWGRRSGKDFITSIIALYEALKLLETPGGCPYAKYKIPRGGNPITILTVATAAPQAAIAFQEMKAKLLQSKYFKDKFIAEGLGAQSMYLLTPQDRIDNEDRRKRGLKPEKGGLVIRAGHSNSDSLLGMQCFVLLMDEVASFAQTDGSSGGHRVYEAMLPSLNTFVRDELRYDESGQPVLDDKGNHAVNKVFDSKVISISSPRGKEGILYEMFRDAEGAPDRLVCRLPTWVVNIKYTKESLRQTFKQFNDESFMMEFGAEFSATAGMNFFVEERVKACWRHTMRMRKVGLPGVMYFAHLDPATTNNNYSMAVCHREFRLNPEKGNQMEQVVILDNLKVWQPSFDGKQVVPISINEVDSHLLEMNSKFHLGLITYDAFESQTTFQMLKRLGVPTKLTRYGKPYKMAIYTELETLINDGRLIMPYDHLLELELLNLQRRYDSGRGFSVMPNKESECKTDDCCDALAGAVYNCISVASNALPQSKLVSMPQSPNSANRTWMSMQGIPYGQRSIDHLRGTRNGGFGIYGR